MSVSTLNYIIHDFSSYSAQHHPNNLLHDKPTDTSSRWSTASNSHPQYVTLKLNNVSIVHNITIGKLTKPGENNLKEFKVFGGEKPDVLTELLHSGLRCDESPETFTLKSVVNGVNLPCQYIKVVPLALWKSSGTFTIASIRLAGCSDPDLISSSLVAYRKKCEEEAVRLCLKHLRQRNYMDMYQALLNHHPHVLLEHPLLTQLHRSLVVDGSFESCEEILEEAFKQELFKQYLSKHKYSPSWNRLSTPGEPSPGMRGGHQMCIDVEGEKIYMFAGWDGKKDLSDFWSYSIPDGKWTCISTNTPGPSGRSCHKMCFDSSRKLLFTLGRYVDVSERSSMARAPQLPIANNFTTNNNNINININNSNGNNNTNATTNFNIIYHNAARNLNNTYMRNNQTFPDTSSDFWCYSIKENKWILLSNDTYADGGPRLIYDHQMCIDEDSQTIYVFGGKIIYTDNTTTNPENRLIYSGLFSYHIPSRKWTMLREDIREKSNKQNMPEEEEEEDMSICSPRGGDPNKGHQNGEEQVNSRYKDGDGTQFKPRIGHSMLYSPSNNSLLIFAGQRNNAYLTDFFMYDITNNKMVEITRDSSTQGGPDSGYTQRATLNPSLNEVHVFFGLMRDKSHCQDSIKNSFWVYNLEHQKWSCVYQNESSDSDYWKSMEFVEPCPRYAHQVVYDSKNQVHYMFGGNSGDTKNSSVRLDDFWSLKLSRPSADWVLRSTRLLLRKQRFIELCNSGDSMEALTYLQSKVSSVVDHKDGSESAQYRALTTHLFQTETDYNTFKERTKLFEELCKFLPDDMTQPKNDIVDFTV